MSQLDEPYLDSLGCLQGLFWGNPHLAFPQQLLDEVGDVTASNWNMFDTATYHIAFGLIKNKSNSLANVVDNSTIFQVSLSLV